MSLIGSFMANVKRGGHERSPGDVVSSGLVLYVLLTSQLRLQLSMMLLKAMVFAFIGVGVVVVTFRSFRFSQ